MMNRRARNLLLLIIVSAAVAVGAWAVVRLRPPKPNESNYVSAPASRGNNAELWARAVERVKEARAETENVAIYIPSELRHYSERHWFLATQVAEVRKFNLQSCQDFVELAALIERNELIVLPAVTDSYVLFGVGARADDAVFNRYQDDHNVELYNEVELRDVYGRLESARAKLQGEISSLRSQLATLRKGDGRKQAVFLKEVTAREQDLRAIDEEKAQLDQAYGRPERGSKLFKDYASLQSLAKNFAGRSFDLEVPTDRLAMKVSMLSSLRPEAFKVMEQIASIYHAKFGRPLPVSSLVRPEQYQRALRRVNRNAVLIDVPPHATGLAFDIDYRYMSGAEQTFLMAELARLKGEGRIEVIRERNANYHVFTFIDGQRPGDDLIRASLDEASVPVGEANHSIKLTAKITPKVESKSRTAKKAGTNSSTKNRAPRKRR